MIDTSLNYALLLSIDEFNDWCTKEPNYSKYILSDYKGIFYNKLIKNLKGANHGLEANSNDLKRLGTESIEKFSIKENKITCLWFTVQYSFGEPVKGVILSLNKILENYTFGTNVVLEDFSKNIDKFKIR